MRPLDVLFRWAAWRQQRHPVRATDPLPKTPAVLYFLSFEYEDGELGSEWLTADADPNEAAYKFMESYPAKDWVEVINFSARQERVVIRLERVGDYRDIVRVTPQDEYGPRPC